MKIRAIAALLIVLLMVNCSSIVHGTTQQVKVDSDPAGAAVTVACGDVHNDPKLVTPAVVTLHRKPGYCAIKLAKDGYEAKEVKFDKGMSGLYFGNILFGGIIGLIVDGANGAMWNRYVDTTNRSAKQQPDGTVKVSLTQGGVQGATR